MTTVRLDQLEVRDGVAIGSSSPWRTALRALVRDRSAVVGAIVIAVIAMVAIVIPLIFPDDYCIAQPDIIGLKNIPPSITHPLGTDKFSRDVLARLICGARVSLSIAFLSVLVAATVGTVYGAIAGYVGGIADSLLMRFVDALLAIPRVLLLIAVATL